MFNVLFHRNINIGSITRANSVFLRERERKKEREREKEGEGEGKSSLSVHPAEIFFSTNSENIQVVDTALIIQVASTCCM